VLDRLVRQHVSGRSDHSATLWKLMMLDAFLRRTQDGSALIGNRPVSSATVMAGATA